MNKRQIIEIIEKNGLRVEVQPSGLARYYVHNAIGVLLYRLTGSELSAFAKGLDMGRTGK